MTAPKAAEVERGNAMLAPRPAPAPRAITVADVWVNPNTGSNLVAKVTVTVPRWHLSIRGCSVVRTKTGGHFVLPPGIPMVRDGVQLKDEAGKARYSPALVFEKAAGARFSDAVIAALKREHPGLLDGESR